MSTTTLALLANLARRGFTVDDDRTAGALAAQAGAAPIQRDVTRCTVSSAATASFILGDCLTNEADPLVWVLNDSPNTINVYPFVGQTMNGSANAALTIAAGGFAFFSRTALDWRGAVFT
jgi:hypothetical protein